MLYILTEKPSITFFVLLTILYNFDRNQQHLELVTPELQGVFTQLNLKSSHPPVSKHTELQEIEKADANKYQPTTRTLLLLDSNSTTRDSRGERPRYWLNIEEYPTGDLALKRAREYTGPEANERAAGAYGKADSFMVSKETVRLWAVARGKRVYALTTDTNLYGLIKLPQELRKRIEELPPQ